jgi:hypothetical protein
LLAAADTTATGGGGGAVMNDQTLFAASGLPARSFTPVGPLLTVAV